MRRGDSCNTPRVPPRARGLLAWVLGLAVAGAGVGGCAGGDGRVHLVIAGSAVGAEGQALASRARAFEATHPDVRVDIRATPDAGDERHQLYVQWFAAGASEPDLLQVDVVWTAELAAAGFLAPIDEDVVDGFFPGAVAAGRYDGKLWAAPWFVDVGLLYWRTDLLEHAPRTLDELAADARAHPAATPVGYAWQGARYEGLVCDYLEVLSGMGGAILDRDGAVVVDSAAGDKALAWLAGMVGTASPPAVVSWQEEQARFSFQNGEALMMRNWPYAAPLLADAAKSKVAGRFATSPLPGDGAHPGAAALGGQALAVNARSEHPALARELLRFLVADDAQLARARIAGQYPPKAALYDGAALAGALPIPPAEARAILERAVPRPVTPVYSELSGVLQIHLHEALTGQATPGDAVRDAAREMRAVLAARALAPPAPGEKAPGASVGPPARPRPLPVLPLAAVVAGAAALAAAALAFSRARTREQAEARFGWRLATPALWLLAVVAGVPLILTFIQSSMDIDLRAPWRGDPFVGLHLYFEIFRSERFLASLAHTAGFTVVSVALELGLGLALALSLHAAFFARGAVRGLVLIPWSIPAVVAAVIWRFLFHAAAPGVPWTGGPWLAWVPIVVADVWKSTPFVTLLLLAGLAQIDPAVLEAARMDGASAAQRLFRVVLPLLRPAIVVAVVFRTLDAVRVFDLIYVLTGGGPGTATETVSLLAYDAMMRDLRFGAGAAISVVVFAVALSFALVYVRLVGDEERS